ncbi:MAG: hypothetical protein D4R65_04900 [Verrucomicrobiaceae bacterium]|nr:MAG: hypothetical protein D4R65_04900 [Verrucomicrobiaceae bacterium]
MSAANTTSRKQPALWPFFLASLIMILLFWGINKWLMDGGGNPEPEEAARAEVRIKNLADLRAENAAKLEKYAWVDRAKGSVQIPVTQAMELVLPELNASQPRAAYPVVTTPAAPAPAPAQPAPAQPAPTPAPPAP